MKGLFENVFILIGVILLIIGIAGLVRSSQLETLIRENERCLYENAKLEDANTRLLEELSETVEDWGE